MKLTDFSRVVCPCHSARYPEAWLRVRNLLRGKGVDPVPFVNGEPGEPGTGHAGRPPDQVNDIPAPVEFLGSPGAWNLRRSFLEVIRQAKSDGLASVLMIEDDLEFSPEFDEVTGTLEIPPDWDLFYFGANHRWHPTTEVGPNLLRLHGSFCTHCLAVRSTVFDEILSLPTTGPIDWAIGVYLHHKVRAYGVWPNIAVQIPGMSRTTGVREDYSEAFRWKGLNWPKPLGGSREDSYHTT